MDNPASLIEVVISREQRRTIKAEPKPGLLVVKAPLHATDPQIASFLADHRRWIETHCAARPERLVLGEPIDWSLVGAELLGDDERERTYRRMCHAAADKVFRKTLQELNLRAPPMRVAALASAWGKCHSTGRIELHWRVGSLPWPLARYVVCHELAHLAHFDHTGAFWAQVDELHPGARKADRELKRWRL
jgi:predicted metal-dependent hydrolase